MRHRYSKKTDTLNSAINAYKRKIDYAKRVVKINVYKIRKTKGDFANYMLIALLIIILGGAVMHNPSFTANAFENNRGRAAAAQKAPVMATPSGDDEYDMAILPKRTANNNDQGRPVVEVQDPASLELARSLAKVDRVPELRDVDKRAVELAHAYDKAKEAPKPFIEPDNGRINFYFGTMVPRVVCRPLRMTDIELEPGERVTGLNIADNARWSVTTSTSGALDMLTTHIIVKPRLPKTATNLLIHTDRRTYAIELVSIEDGQYMPFIGFLYPASPSRIGAETEEAWENLMIEYQRADEYSAETKAYSFGTVTDPKNINLEYTIKVTSGKNVVWKPTNAYDAGGKTYIVMNKNMKFSEAPVIFEKKDKKEKILNYRVHDNIYIIDRLFDSAIMVAGKDRVLIRRNTPLSAAGTAE